MQLISNELISIRQHVEDDVQIMDSSVGNKTAPPEILDNQCSNSLIESFDNLFYELAAFADVHNFTLSPQLELSSSLNATVNQTESSNNLSMFQFPKRKFPTFSGKMTEWQGFEDLFKSILSHAPELPDVERFEYLKISLEGEASILISHLALTAGNYQSAWKILRARYGNKCDLARIHLEALLKPQVVKFDNATSIKTIMNTILEHTATLDNLEFITRHWSPILIHIFEKYLDYELRARWELIIGDKHFPQLTEFIDFLRSHLRSAEVHSNQTTSSSNSKINKGTHFSNSKSYSSFSSKVLATTTSQPSSSLCPLCQKQHSIRKCPSFNDKNATERFRIAKGHRLCINCLGTGHSSVNCPSKYKCNTCNRSHNTLLHFQPSRMDIPPPIVNAASLIVKGPFKRVILLSTVLLNVIVSDGQQHIFRALLDSGSQASFITDRLASDLMLNANGLIFISLLFQILPLCVLVAKQFLQSPRVINQIRRSR